MRDLPPAFDSGSVEAEVGVRWDAEGASHTAIPSGDDERFSILLPPPNVTAALHLGHALNNTLQDILIRYHRMIGASSLWMPGTDHAGIATQSVVEKRLRNEGLTRLELGREAFVARATAWKDEYETTILEQLKAMGASCDWDRVRFTMDEICTVAVRHAFYQLFSDGLLYRGKRLVNWDPATQTALADDEVEMVVTSGSMWYLRYPLADGSGHITVATTRPETMFGDTAVALNPKDPRAASLVGKQIMLPIVGRLIPIVADDFVVMPEAEGDRKAQYATGFLKVTPAHDPNDWSIGERHQLPIINVLAPDGRISGDHGWDDVSEAARPFLGLSREDARAAVVEWFDRHDLLADVKPYEHSVGHSYRSHVAIEPWLSDQWYVAVTDDRLSGSAVRALRAEEGSEPGRDSSTESLDRPGDGELEFFPQRYRHTFLSWHENIRDWCISRQLWWGHRIPVWLRLTPEAEAASEVQFALQGSEPGEFVTVSSRWSGGGGAHRVRRVGGGLVEEAVCVPPEATLRRLGAAGGASEADVVAALEADGFYQDPDVLDTWFSSGLWPLSTMGWPYPEDYPETEGLLAAFQPTSVLTTAREIITLWVSRMVMLNRYFMNGQLPFKHVFIHAMIQDGHGQKMSKSLGNGVDPRDIIESHGADALRFGLAHLTTETQDVRLPVNLICPHSGEEFEPETTLSDTGHVVAAPIQTSPTDPSKQMVTAFGVSTGQYVATPELPLARNSSPKFDLGRNFANKIWNVTRFGISRLESLPRPEGIVVDPVSCAFPDRWILHRLAGLASVVEDSVVGYRFNEVANALYDFVWRDLSDRYLEAVKPTIQEIPAQRVVLGAVLDATLRIVHPVMPFVTEGLWGHVREMRAGEIVGLALPGAPVLATAAWPEFGWDHDHEIERTFVRVDTAARAVRRARSEAGVRPQRKVDVHVDSTLADLIAATDGFFEALAGAKRILESGERPMGALPVVVEGSQLWLSDLTDRPEGQAETEQLVRKAEELSQWVGRLRERLADSNYVERAPSDVVGKTRAQLAQAEADLAAAMATLDGFP